jgi:3-hydroxyacyl-[acyl-carrier-protein] dehydratase
MSGFLDLKDIIFLDKKDGFISYLSFPHDDPVFLGHYPNHPILPASLVIDICCDMLCDFLSVTEFSKLGLSIDKASFYQGVRPGNTIQFEFTFTKITKEEISQIDVKLKLGQKQITTISLKNSVANKVDINRHILDYNEAELESCPAIDYLPQRFPLLLIDRILGNEESQSCRAIKYVSYSDYCYRDTCRNDLVNGDLAYPHGAVIEGIEQSAALLLGIHWKLTANDIVIVIGRVSGISFYHNAYPGDIIKFHSILDHLSETYAVLSGVAMVDDEVLLTIDKIFVVKQAPESITL